MKIKLSLLLILSMSLLLTWKINIVDALTGSGCTFTQSYTNVRWYNIYNDVYCSIDGIWLTHFWPRGSVWGSYSTTTDLTNFQSTNYGDIWFCTFWSCTGMASPPTNTWSCATINCPMIWNSAFLRTWPKGDTGATGLTGITGATGATGAGIQWEDGWSAYQVAVINGFSGTEIEWLGSLIWPAGTTGATGAISLDLSQSGIIQINSVLQTPTETGLILPDSGSTYIPITYQQNWITYVNEDRAKQIVFDVGFLIIIWWLFWWFMIKKFFIRKKSPF